MKTAITELLNIEYPIIQGAMAWVADCDLASAVSNAGGLGIVGTGGDTKEQVQAKVEKMKELTDKPFGVNVYLLSPHADEVVEYLLTSGIKVVTTGAGNPSKYMEGFAQAGITVIPVVSSVALARRMERIGASAVIVEGMEAGGHIGRSTTFTLLPQVVDAVDIPVIAAGGIGDGRGMAAALTLGAEAIQVGTRFVVADESNAHDNFKNAILKAGDLDTVVTGESTGHPVRVLRNRMTRDYLRVEKEESGKDKPDLSRLEDLTKGSLYRAVVEGDTDTGSMMAGQVAGLINKRESVSDMIKDYMDGAKETFAKMQKFYD